MISIITKDRAIKVCDLKRVSPPFFLSQMMKKVRKKIRPKFLPKISKQNSIFFLVDFSTKKCSDPTNLQDKLAKNPTKSAKTGILGSPDPSRRKEEIFSFKNQYFNEKRRKMIISGNQKFDIFLFRKKRN